MKNNKQTTPGQDIVLQKFNQMRQEVSMGLWQLQNQLNSLNVVLVDIMEKQGYQTINEIDIPLENMAEYKLLMDAYALHVPTKSIVKVNYIVDSWDLNSNENGNFKFVNKADPTFEKFIQAKNEEEAWRLLVKNVRNPIIVTS